MQCFTSTECSEWLRQRAIIEAPYPEAPPSLQFEPPIKPSCLTAFTRDLFIAFGEFPGALLVFTDWALYRPDEMALVASLRRGHNENRPLIEAPGHLFVATDEAEAIGQSYLALIFCWSAYLYLASGRATVFFWEGDLVDFWSSEASLVQTARAVVQRYGLKLTSGHSP